MTYTTTASRSDLQAIHLPSSVPGKWFSVTVTPLTEEQAREQAFRQLKGIAGCKLDLDQIREERLGERLGEKLFETTDQVERPAQIPACLACDRAGHRQGNRAELA